jgi:hypothetical protein
MQRSRGLALPVHINKMDPASQEETGPLRIGKPAAGLGGGMRGARLNDESIVLPRRARAYTANELFLHIEGLVDTCKEG